MESNYDDNRIHDIDELNSEKFTRENHEDDNSLNILFYYKDTEKNLSELGYEIVGFCNEPNYYRAEQWSGKSYPMPGMMICDLKSGKEFWSHISAMGLEIFLYQPENEKKNILENKAGKWEFEKLMNTRNS